LAIQPEAVERLANTLGEDNVYRTDEDGTIEFVTDGETLWVKTDARRPLHIQVSTAGVSQRSGRHA